VVNEALADAGRDPSSIVHSAALVVAVGRDEDEFRRRAAAIGREPAELREHGVAGTVAEAADRLAQVRADGIERVYLQVLDLHDLDHLELIAREVAPQV
jgi:alkanesulfonate monooxygenase SsuD/methylene tetrahydromethanopterin reductase-like flavin-dependent oxidoreductase (luciferase family)